MATNGDKVGDQIPEHYRAIFYSELGDCIFEYFSSHHTGVEFEDFDPEKEFSRDFDIAEDQLLLVGLKKQGDGIIAVAEVELRRQGVLLLG